MKDLGKWGLFTDFIWRQFGDSMPLAWKMRCGALCYPSPQPSPPPLTWPSWWISMISGESWCYSVPCPCTNEPLPHSHLLTRRPVIGRCKVTLRFTEFIFKRDGLFFPPASGTEDLSLLLDGLDENTKIGEHLYILFDLPRLPQIGPCPLLVPYWALSYFMYSWVGTLEV